MASAKVREMFEAGTAAFNAHDAEAFAAQMADDVEARAPGGAAFRGREAVKAYYRSWLEAFPDARVEIQALHVLDDVAIEEGIFTGTHRGALRTPDGDLPPTGRPVRAEYVQVVRYRGDAVASFHLVYDRAELLEQLGLAPSMEHGAMSQEMAERVQAQAQPGLQTH